MWSTFLLTLLNIVNFTSCDFSISTPYLRPCTHSTLVSEETRFCPHPSLVQVFSVSCQQLLKMRSHPKDYQSLVKTPSNWLKIQKSSKLTENVWLLPFGSSWLVWFPCPQSSFWLIIMVVHFLIVLCSITYIFSGVSLCYSVFSLTVTKDNTLSMCIKHIIYLSEFVNILWFLFFIIVVFGTKWPPTEVSLLGCVALLWWVWPFQRDCVTVEVAYEDLCIFKTHSVSFYCMWIKI